MQRFDESPTVSRRSELVEQYRMLHEEDPGYGKSSERQCGFVQVTLDDLPPIRSILDYGCGKSRLVDWLAVINGAKAYRYDPAIPEFSTLPVDSVDLVINTDVLEHIDETDLDDILSDIRRLSPNVYFNIATSPARAVLPNGENAHASVRSKEWWGELLSRHFSTLRPVPAWRAHRCSFVTWPRRSADAKRSQVARAPTNATGADHLLARNTSSVESNMDSVLALFDPQAEPDTHAMITTLLKVDRHNPGKGRQEIGEKLRTLANGFLGGPLILFYHAGLIVHLRRQIDSELNWKKFDRLWKDHRGFLLQNLNSRWLTAACDTIVDYSEFAEERAAALAGTLLAGMIKLYETERHITGSTTATYKPIGRLPLYDGLYGFQIGSGNMVKNLIDRASRPAPPDSIALRILQELLHRARHNDTVLNRFAAVHERKSTLW